MVAFIASFVLVLLAEMGDKTQLMAMAFTARYNAYKVMAGVFLATLLNQSLAVAAGHYLTKIVPIGVISVAAAISFIIFGLWIIRGDKSGGEEKRRSRFGPIATVAMAFFLAEMGDKTQLATISLAVEYKNIFGVLAGTTLAMLAANAIGIIVGIFMHKHIPEKAVKWFSAGVFILFGIIGLYKALVK